MGKQVFSVGETKGMREREREPVRECMCVCVRDTLCEQPGQGFTDTLVTFHNYVE